jgi:hypothetical protein
MVDNLAVAIEALVPTVKSHVAAHLVRVCAIVCIEAARIGSKRSPIPHQFVLDDKVLC